MVGFPGKALIWDATRGLQLYVHAAVRLHFMMLNGHTTVDQPETMQTTQVLSHYHSNVLL